MNFEKEIPDGISGYDAFGACQRDPLSKSALRPGWRGIPCRDVEYPD